MIRIVLAGALAASVFASPALAQNLVVNGDFQTGNFNGWTKSGDQSLSDVVANNATSNTTPLWRVGSTNLTYISQTLNTLTGSAYNLSFDWYNTATTGEEITVDFNGVTVFGSSNTAHSWNSPTVISGLLATGPSTVLRFGARNLPSFTRFDNISVAAATIATPSVPEPGTWSMLVLGFGAMGYAVRRRTKARTSVSFA